MTSASYLNLLQPDLASSIIRESPLQLSLNLDAPGPRFIDGEWICERKYTECQYCGHQTKKPSIQTRRTHPLWDPRAWCHYSQCDSCCNFNKRHGFRLTYEDRAFLNAAPWCALCGTQEDLHIDHCHKTNRIRGYLCEGHNQAIGKFGDDPTLLLFAIHYLIPPDEITN